MKFICTLIAVRNLEASKEFYRNVLGLEVVADFGANVTLTGGLALQTADTWKDFIQKRDDQLVFGGNAGELYFEEDDIDVFAARLALRSDIELVHPLHTHAWGQRVIRFYDPDRHIIEVGENMAAVVRCFIDGGMTVADTARRMGVSEAYVRLCLGTDGE